MIYLIGGVPRSGKTTFAGKLREQLNISHIELDLIKNSIERSYPDLNSKRVDRAEQFLEFTKGLINQYQYYKKDVIIEGTNVSPAFVSSIENQNQLLTTFVGYPKTSVTLKLTEIRKYASEEDWTRKRSDDELTPLIEKYISESKVLEIESKDYDFDFLDTSDDFIKQMGLFLKKYL